MPTSLPVNPSRSRATSTARRPWLGWSLTDWALFVASYGVIVCAVLFAAPADKGPRRDPAAVSSLNAR